MNDHPSSPKPRNNGAENKTPLFSGLLGWIRGVGGAQNGEDSARDALEEVIEEREEAEVPIDEDERILLAMGGEYLTACSVGDQLLWGAAEPLKRMLKILREQA